MADGFHKLERTAPPHTSAAREGAFDLRPLDPEIWSIEEASRVLRCSEDTLRRVSPRDLPVYRVGKANLYLRDDVLRYVKSRPVSKAGAARSLHDGRAEASVDALIRRVLSSDPVDAREPS